METKISKRGGKREGAGRPPLLGTTKVPTQIRLDADLDKVFKDNRELNKNRFINEAVRQRMIDEGLL